MAGIVKSVELMNVRTGTLVRVPVETHHNNARGISFYLDKRTADARPVFMRPEDYERADDEQKKEWKAPVREVAPVVKKPEGSRSLTESFLAANDDERRKLIERLRELSPKSKKKVEEKPEEKTS